MVLPTEAVFYIKTKTALVGNAISSWAQGIVRKKNALVGNALFKQWGRIYHSMGTKVFKKGLPTMSMI